MTQIHLYEMPAVRHFVKVVTRLMTATVWRQEENRESLLRGACFPSETDENVLKLHSDHG